MSRCPPGWATWRSRCPSGRGSRWTPAWDAARSTSSGWVAAGITDSTSTPAAACPAAGAAGALEVGWGWGAALMCLCAGVGLHVVAPSSPTMYVGALVRFVLRPRWLWLLRAAVVLTAPVAGVGPALYTALALAQATLLESAPRALEPEWRRALGTGLAGLAFVLAADELGLTVGSEELLWSVLLASAGLSAFWWSGQMNPSLRRSIGV